jgi:hypothetical protein
VNWRWHVAPDFTSVSLIEQLQEVGFKSSLVATYSCYFPFYEDVILRRLIASGCTHNILMVDAGRVAEAFQKDDLRPQRAGRDYTLIPIVARGAFHPKVFLKLGKQKGRLFVGSHNATLAGFGLNDETTTLFSAEGASARSSSGPLRAVLQFLSALIPKEPAELGESFQALTSGVGWIQGPAPVPSGDRQVLFGGPDNPTLWSQVRALAPSNVSHAFIAGPFFDSQMTFVRQVQRDLEPKRLTIGIDPESVEMDSEQARALKGVDFINVRAVPKIKHRREGTSAYLHSKLLWIKGAGGSQLVVTGSANPSAPAFLAESGERNVEIAVADTRARTPDALGIPLLLEARALTPADWKQVSERVPWERQTASSERCHLSIAIPAPGGFIAGEALKAGVRLEAFDSAGTLIGEAVADGDVRSIAASEGVSENAAFLRSPGRGSQHLLIVHRPQEIAQTFGTSTTKALRQALGAFDEDLTQFETLLKLTEKVIFDSDDIVREELPRQHAIKRKSAGEDIGPESLKVDAQGRKGRKPKPHLASGDVLVLLDTLIRRLGEGLTAPSPETAGVKEVEVGSDDEDGGEIARSPDLPQQEDLAAACRSKVRRLIGRMEKQFKRTAESGEARRAVVQLAAVLNVLQALRVIEQRPEWKKRRLELVHRDDQYRLLEAAAIAMTWGTGSLLPRSTAETEGIAFEEQSIVLGLLVWLAWVAGVDLRQAALRRGRQGVDDESWRGVQMLLTVLGHASEDERAMDLARSSTSATLTSGVDPDRWLHVHLDAAIHAAGCVAGAAPPTTAAPSPGDIVVLNESCDPRVRLVLDVIPTGTDAKVVVFDSNEESEQRIFMASRLKIWPLLPSEAQQKAG